MEIIYNKKNKYVRLTPKNKIMVNILKGILKLAGCSTVNKYGSYESESSVYINNVKLS